MMEKIKIVFSNVQFRNILYLFLGLIGMLILIFIFNPKLEYQNFPKVKDENEVVEFNKNKTIDVILEEYKEMTTYYYDVSYKEYVVNGYAIADIFNSDIKYEEVEDLLVLLTPNKIYNFIKNGILLQNNVNSFIYKIRLNMVTCNLEIKIQDEKVKEIVLKLDEDFRIVYGGIK